MEDLKPIPLSELIDSLEFDSDEFSTLVDLRDAIVVHVDRAVTDDPAAWLEEFAECLSDDSDEQFKMEHAVASDLGGERFICPPSKFEYHEYEKMRDFIADIDDENAAVQLAQAIRGKGAFRYFKDTLHRLNMLDQWYAYRHQTMKDFVIEWANQQKIPYTDDT